MADQRLEVLHRCASPAWGSETLQATDWPGLEVVHEDLVEFMREANATDGPQLRTLGSVSLVKKLLAAGLLDRLKLVVCPLVLGETGVEPLFAGLPDIGFDLLSTKILDERVMLVEYRPTGLPPYTS
jgi:dihydrofolate reductase